MKARTSSHQSAGRRRGIVVAIVLLVAGLLLPAVPGATGSLIAKVTNSQNTSATAIFGCAGIAYGLGATLAWPLDDGYNVLGTSARDVSQGSSNPGTYSATGVAYRQLPSSCPRDRVNGTPYATVFDGITGYVTNTAPFTLTNTFTESIWFRTNTTKGGWIIGFGSTPRGGSAQHDRMIWMSNAGNLVFGVYPRINNIDYYKTIISPLTYNDNNYHLATASLGANGMRLYVDGAQVAADASTTTAQIYNQNAMYLNVAYDSLVTWLPAPSSYYFAGSLRFADYFPSQLTAAQITALYTNGI